MRERGYSPPKRMVEEVYSKIIESLTSGRDPVGVLEVGLLPLLSEVSLNINLNENVRKLWIKVLKKIWDSRFPEIPPNEALLENTDPQYLPLELYNYISNNREFVLRLTKKTIGLKSDVDHTIRMRILLYLFTAVTYVLRSLGYVI